MKPKLTVICNNCCDVCVCVCVRVRIVLHIILNAWYTVEQIIVTAQASSTGREGKVLSAPTIKYDDTYIGRKNIRQK